MEKHDETDSMEFIDWDRMPERGNNGGDGGGGGGGGGVDEAFFRSVEQTQLKLMARSGRFSTEHSSRAAFYRHALSSLPCRLVTPDASVYRDSAPRLFRLLPSSGSAAPASPGFADGWAAPRYCLTAAGQLAVARVLRAVELHFPDVTFCPALPATVALLAHYSRSEAELFAGAARILAHGGGAAEEKQAPRLHLLDQTFLGFEASCMTFGDLAAKYCPSAHRIIVSREQDVLQVYSGWLRWLFEDLPFEFAVRVFDCFLLEGHKVLYRAALALLKLFKSSVKKRALTNSPGPTSQDGVCGEIRSFARSLSLHVSPTRLLDRGFRVRLLSRREISLLRLANESALQAAGISRVQRSPHKQKRSVQLSVDLSAVHSDVVSAQQMHAVWSWIPERFTLTRPLLLFTTAEHGYSLSRFYTHCDGHEPTVLLIKTTDGEVCGAFLSSDWAERRKSKGTMSFFGTGECFVFRLHPEVERYEWVVIRHPELAQAEGASDTGDAVAPLPPAGVEEPRSDRLSPFLATKHFGLPSKTASMFMAGNAESIIIGGGGGQALYLDSELNHGRTAPCDTFANPPLCTETFQVQILEVWGFAESGQ
ncbi:TBC1 domain family member 24 isoform X1 [Lampetra fluviatilis]